MERVVRERVSRLARGPLGADTIPVSLVGDMVGRDDTKWLSTWEGRRDGRTLLHTDPGSSWISHKKSGDPKMQDRDPGELQGLEVLGRHGAYGPYAAQSWRCSSAHCWADVS